MSSQRESIVILGGGIAGLTAAWYLKGLEPTIIEQSPALGGCVQTLQKDGYILELGPNTFLNSSDALWKLAEETGAAQDRISTPADARYIYKRGRLIPVPAGPGIILSNILSLKGRIRLLAEPFIRSSPKSDDESLAEFARRRFGNEVLNTLVTPFVSGVYAGDPEALSLKAVFPRLIEIEKRYGSIFRGMRELKSDLKAGGLGSFKAGASTLVNSIEVKNAVRNARVTHIERTGKQYNICYEQDGGQKSILIDKVISALPAHVIGDLLSHMDKELGEVLRQVYYVPMVVVHVGYKRCDIPHPLNGFGFLVPRGEGVRILGCLWSSSLFPHRAPEGCALLTVFLGGALDPGAIDLADREIISIVERETARTLKVRAAPSFTHITRHTRAIPQYTIGHRERLDKIQAELAKFPGLYLTGAYFDGVSVAATIEHAIKTVRQIK